MKRFIGVLVLAGVLGASGALAQSQCSSNNTFRGSLPGDSPGNETCIGFSCEAGIESNRFIRLDNPSCDPDDPIGNPGGCTVRLGVEVEYPGLEEMIDEFGLSSSPTPKIWWFDDVASAPACSGSTCSPGTGVDAVCGESFAGGKFNADFNQTYVRVGGVTCDNILTRPEFFSMRSKTCSSNSTCREDSTFNNLQLATYQNFLDIGCMPEEPKHDCDTCVANPSGDSSATGDNCEEGAGPGVKLHFRAFGVGGVSMPGTTADWNERYGIHWTHDGERRIITDAAATPPESHVWLINNLGSFREFEDTNMNGSYDIRSPNNEYRALTKTMSGWTLEELDGGEHTFDNDGWWLGHTDRKGNVKTAMRGVDGLLEEIHFPDGRHEEFTFDPIDGKLQHIDLYGVDGTTFRRWTYDWFAGNLVSIEEPDGRGWRYEYSQPGFLNLITAKIRIGTDDSERVEQAYEYNSAGLVSRTWKGDISFDGPDAVDKWSYGYTIPAPGSERKPTEVAVVDPLGDISTYTIDYPDPDSDVPVVTEVEGGCPTCGIGPNTTLEYGTGTFDKLKVVKETDGRGNETEYAWDSRGQMISRTDAANNMALDRTITWDYADANFPVFLTSTSRVSTDISSSDLRETTFTLDGEGDVTTITRAGRERDDTDTLASYSYVENRTYNGGSGTGGGQILTIDPPGHGTDDIVEYTYDPTRGNGFLVMDTRIDPLIGTTTFDYDTWNRRTNTTDVNGVETVTEYDEVDRVRKVWQEDGVAGETTEDLVSETVYNVFGDLERSILPEGNVIEYSYDQAGRLTAVERKPDASTNAERTFYTLDGFGNRTKEEQQRWESSAWVTKAETDFNYDTRCFLDSIEFPDGTFQRFEYDCAGNLSEMRDELTAEMDDPTFEYMYDSLDRLTKTIQPWSAGGTVETSYGYDIQDHLTSVTDGEGNVTTYEYSDRDLLTEEVSPVAGRAFHSYDEHGELVRSEDARGEVSLRTLDVLDRVTLVDVSNDNLDTTYTYDVGAFGMGRLTSIDRPSYPHSYAYDRFGRMTEDGDLTLDHDENGNVTEVTYGDGTVATHTYDFADRSKTLDVTPSGGVAEAVVDDVVYLPSGPVERLDFSSGLSEAREFTDRYFVDRLRLGSTASFPDGSLLDWDYSVNSVGNVTNITDGNGGAARIFGYLPHQYFLTSASGPWSGPLSWVYDKTGNRESETRGAQVDDLVFTAGTSGNTSLLDRIDLGAPLGGSREYTFGAAGHLEEVDASGNVIDFTNDAAGRLAAINRTGGDSVAFRYDGRGFLRQIQQDLIFADGFETGDFACWSDVEPGTITGTCPMSSMVGDGTMITYASEGILMSLMRAMDGGGMETINYFYFGGRPVAQLRIVDGVIGDVETITTDHLGTPVVLADEAAAVQWSGGFEPFGEDWQAQTVDAANDNGMYLRLPGQWSDPVWEDAASAASLHQNLWRWYEFGTGRYTRADPLGLVAGPNVMAYVDAQPTSLVDPTGLQGFQRQFITPQNLQDEVERACAQGAFGRNFIEMRRANWLYSDSYFHCKANCEAAQCGAAGEESACVLGEVRELADRLFKGDTPFEVASDKSANQFGRDQGRTNPSKSCKILCADYRPKGLPEEF